MGNNSPLTPEQVGHRIKERRNDLGISMPELGRRVGVNKSTIQRYETDGVDPKRTMVINGLAEALLTTPEWLTGMSEEKEYSAKTLCQMDIEKHMTAFLDELNAVMQGQPRQQMLTTFLCHIVDLYSVFCVHFARAMTEADRIAEDEGLKQSIQRYAIEAGDIIEKVYRREMEQPIEDMKRFLDGLYHLYDLGRDRVKMSDLLSISTEARERLNEDT